MTALNSEPLDGFFSGRVLRTAASASNVALQKARAAAAAGKRVIFLTSGEPDFPTPENIRAAAIRAIENGQTRYTPVDGTPQLKAAIAEKFRRENELSFEPDQIIAGNGAKHVIFNAFLATVQAGDEVVIPTPSWVSYPEMVKFAGGTPVLVSTEPQNGFKLTPEELEKVITPATKWLVLNTPNNPAGSIYSREDLQALAEILKKHPKIWVMTDDIYEHIIFDGLHFYTMAQAAPEIADRVLTINGVSKAYAMTGWRIGYAAGSKALIREMSKIQTQSTSNPCSISQAAAAEALTGPQDSVRENALEFQTRRDLVIERMRKMPGVSVDVPQGAFYVFASVKELIGKRSGSGEVMKADRDIASHFLDFGLSGVAGNSYGCEGYFRITTAASRENLMAGCEIMAKAIADLR